jgi:hypothetical protein
MCRQIWWGQFLLLSVAPCLSICTPAKQNSAQQKQIEGKFEKRGDLNPLSVRKQPCSLILKETSCGECDTGLTSRLLCCCYLWLCLGSDSASTHRSQDLQFLFHALLLCVPSLALLLSHTTLRSLWSQLVLESENVIPGRKAHKDIQLKSTVQQEKWEREGGETA